MTKNTTSNNASYVEWGTILAGSALAAATSIILMQFGNSLGLSALAAMNNENITRGVVLTAGYWIFMTQLISSMLGGYTAGRMRTPMENSATHESEMRDGAHGLLVWATSTVAITVALAIGAFLASIVTQHTSEAEQHIRNATELAKHAGIVFGFATAAGAIVSAAAAWGMATLGGDHRDRAVDISKYISFRKR